MSVFPTSVLEPLVTIHTFSLESVGTQSISFNNLKLDNCTSQTWTLANRAFLVPFVISKPITVVKLFTMNGATVSGNMDMGIYTLDGTRIVSMGSTAQAGINAIQSFDITDTQLGAGTYYMALAIDNGTSTIFSISESQINIQSYGCAIAVSAFPLPANLTPVVNIAGKLHLLALTTRTVI